MKILLFIPVYNCEKQIARVIEKVTPHRNVFTEILIVDNQSTDQTIVAAKTYATVNNLKNITIVRNNDNYSLGGSHKIAFQYAIEHGHDFVAVCHGDDQADVSDLVPLIQNGDYIKYDCLLGSRFHKDSNLIGYSRFRIFGNIVLNRVCDIVCRARILDQGSGLNFYKVPFVSDQRIWNFPDNLTFNVYLLYHAFFTKAPTHFFPISWREEDQISNAKVFKQAWQILKLSLKTIIARDYLYLPTNKPRIYSCAVAFKS